MCGIGGFIDVKPGYDPFHIAMKMGQVINHRGPDSDGIWQDSNFGINLVHKRLSIIDLSSAGHQPMISDDGRYVIVFNGEIYNFNKIKKVLSDEIVGIVWRGTSDTEVILKAVEAYGLAETLKKLEGMFAFALWDRDKHCLSIARDRIGEKPLYFGFFHGVFGFASDIGFLRAHPKFECNINRDAIGQLMLHGSIPAPISIFNGIKKLKPGHYLSMKHDDIINGHINESAPYWEIGEFSLRDVYGSDETVVTRLDDLLRGVVSDQMIADVPVGCFLSGGVDSSTMAALMQLQSATPIHTFSIGFENHEYNEAVFAKSVSKHLGTNHTEMYVTDKDARNVIPLLPSIYSEPFADSSQIPTYLLCKIAKQHVKVAISGDGGDEIFAGYNRYLLSEKVYGIISVLPQWMKGFLRKIIPFLSRDSIKIITKLTKLQTINLLDKLYKVDALLQAKDFFGFYNIVISHWYNYSDLVLGCELKSSLWNEGKDFKFGNIIDAMQCLDLKGYLPDDILVKVDRAAMSNSLEARAPFLNHRVIEFAQSLPISYRIRNGTTKWCLREVLYKYVPKDLIDRPKSGFAIPLNDWLRGSLKDWALDLLSADKIVSQGYLNNDLLAKKMVNHLSGKENNGYYLWNVLMFQQWLDDFKRVN